MKTLLLITQFAQAIIACNPYFNDLTSNNCVAQGCAQGKNISLHFAASDVEQTALTLVEALAKIKNPTLVLDAGHGGKDTGTRDRGLIEKTLTLQMTLKLGELIKQSYPEINVIYTRQDDVFVSLYERANIANRAHADLFISIHCNSLKTNTGVRGTETYVMGLHTSKENLEIVKRENASMLLEENYEQTYKEFDINSAEGHILNTMYQSAHLEKSISLASKIETQFVDNSKRKSLGVKQAGFVVLRATSMPSILIETGFLSNAFDANLLKTDDGQNQVVQSIINALSQYCEEGNLSCGSAYTSNNPVSTPSVDFDSQPMANPVTQIVAKKEPAKQVEEIVVNEKASQVAPSNVGLNARTDDYTFKIQIAAGVEKINTSGERWKIVRDLEVEQTQQTFKYVAGKFKEFSKAVSYQNLLRRAGFKDAFVVAYQSGVRTELDAALKKLNILK